MNNTSVKFRLCSCTVNASEEFIYLLLLISLQFLVTSRWTHKKFSCVYEEDVT